MPLQLPPPLQSPLYAVQGLLKEPSDPPTANDVVRAATYTHLVLDAHSMYHTASLPLSFLAMLIHAFRYRWCCHS